MEIYLFIKNGRVSGTSETESPGAIKLDVPNDHEVLKNPRIFRYENNQLVKDTAFQQQKIKEITERKNKPSAEEVIETLKKQNADLTLSLMMKGVI